jgi:hypothetical protein
MERAAAEPTQLAEAFLQEAVFRSRAKQAAGAALAVAPVTPPAPGAADARRCGLGLRAEVELELTPRAAELAADLWPAGLDAAALERVRAMLHEWVELQDALDRKRNHFLKAFRQAHGFDRNAYPPELRAEFEAGLERVNAEVSERRRAAAAALLSGTGSAPPPR